MNPSAKVGLTGSGGTSFSDGTLTFRENAALRKRKLHTFSDEESELTFKLMKGVMYIYSLKVKQEQQ